jgi:hypothetical protein
MYRSLSCFLNSGISYALIIGKWKYDIEKYDDALPLARLANHQKTGLVRDTNVQIAI